jgi:hypothetical protein
MRYVEVRGAGEGVGLHGEVRGMGNMVKCG